MAGFPVATPEGANAEAPLHPGAVVASSRRDTIRLQGENEESSPGGSNRSVMENPGIFKLVCQSFPWSQANLYVESNLTMNIPESTLRILTFMLSKSLHTWFTIPPNSSSLSPPRLFTSRTTVSFPSPRNGRKDLSGSSVEVRILSSIGMSSLRGGAGDRRWWPLSLCMPIPISISTGESCDSLATVPGTYFIVIDIVRQFRSYNSQETNMTMFQPDTYRGNP